MAFVQVLMSSQGKTYLKFGAASVLMVFLLGYLAYTGVQDSKSYYVTISELHKMGNGAYSKRLRVAGNVQPGSIKRTGTHVQFVLMEQDQLLSVDYTGTEAPPDTFKDDSQALADGSFGRDGVFHAKALQAKCASKYAPQQPGTPANGMPPSEAPKSVTQVQRPAVP
jgi:cytochrome c-type biogenesis protein CcmE